MVCFHEVQLKNNCAKAINVCSLENGAGKTKECGVLPTGREKKTNFPTGWEGRFWARYTDVKPLVGWPQSDSLAEIKLDGWQGMDYYDISLVDGFAVGLKIQPLPGTFQRSTAANCRTIACQADLIGNCPKELKLYQGRRVVACQSACTKFHTDQYCCTGS
jgi:Thaumatin family